MERRALITPALEADSDRRLRLEFSVPQHVSEVRCRFRSPNPSATSDSEPPADLPLVDVDLRDKRPTKRRSRREHFVDQYQRAKGEYWTLIEMLHRRDAPASAISSGSIPSTPEAPPPPRRRRLAVNLKSEEAPNAERRRHTTRRYEEQQREFHDSQLIDYIRHLDESDEESDERTETPIANGYRSSSPPPLPRRSRHVSADRSEPSTHHEVAPPKPARRRHSPAVVIKHHTSNNRNESPEATVRQLAIEEREAVHSDQDDIRPPSPPRRERHQSAQRRRSSSHHQSPREESSHEQRKTHEGHSVRRESRDELEREAAIWSAVQTNSTLAVALPKMVRHRGTEEKRRHRKQTATEERAPVVEKHPDAPSTRGRSTQENATPARPITVEDGELWRSYLRDENDSIRQALQLLEQALERASPVDGAPVKPGPEVEMKKSLRMHREHGENETSIPDRSGHIVATTNRVKRRTEREPSGKSSHSDRPDHEVIEAPAIARRQREQDGVNQSFANRPDYGVETSIDHDACTPDRESCTPPPAPIHNARCVDAYLREKEEREEREAAELAKGLPRPKPIPAHVRLPLYEQMQSVEERRRMERREKSAEALRLAQPPKFSPPSTRQPPEQPKPEPFRARPIPAHVYKSQRSRQRERQHEVERRLRQRQERKAELLRSSSLPPQMQRRGEAYFFGRTTAPHRRRPKPLTKAEQRRRAKPSINAQVPDFELLHRREELRREVSDASARFSSHI